MNHCVHHFLIMSTKQTKKRPDRKLNHFLFIVRIDDKMFNGEKNCFTNNGDDRKGLDDDGGEDKVDPCKTKFMKKYEEFDFFS